MARALSRQVLLNIPNLVTYGRIAVIPLIMLLMMSQGPHREHSTNVILSLVAAFFFILAGISDLVDGHFARKYGMVSLMGKFVDPLADKLIHLAVMILMIPMGRLPAWLVVVLVSREMLISGLRAVAIGEGVEIPADRLGKKKTAWLNCGLSGLLIWYPIFGVSSYTFGWFCMVMGTIYSLISGGNYIWHFYRSLKNQ